MNEIKSSKEEEVREMSNQIHSGGQAFESQDALVESKVRYPGIVDQKTLAACLETAEQVIRDPRLDRVERFRRTRAKLIAQVKAHPLSFDEWNTSGVDRGWQPIKSAPKGRKVIVAYLNPLNKWRRVMARYYAEGTLECETNESGYAPEGWYEECETQETLWPVDGEPLFWVSILASPDTLRTSVVEDEND